MNTQRIIVLGIALVAAGGAAFLVRGMLGGGAQVAAAKPAPQIAMSEVLVANANLTPGQALTTEYGYLKTAKLYKDFHLAVKFRCEGDGNSGVFFHTDFKPGTADVSQGLQFEVDCTINKHTGGIYGDGREWIVWPAPENETVVRLGDWNEYLLKVEGNRYVARLNGVQLVDFTDPKPRSFDGAIALQLHAGGHGNMKFKDIYIRDLTKR